MIEHKPAFDPNAKPREDAEAKRQSDARMMAATYARVFSGNEDGKAVLSDLRRKFGHARPRFDIRDKNHSSITAALIDGQCSVLLEIEAATMKGGGTV
jgi:hypothetical protein